MKTVEYEKFIQDRQTAVKAWLQKTIIQGNVSVTHLAEIMGLSESAIYKAASTNEPQNNFHLHNLPVLIQETGDFTILDEIEAMFGRVAIAVTGDPKELVANLKALVAALEEK